LADFLLIIRPIN